MKKFGSLGKILSKKEQKSIIGGDVGGGSVHCGLVCNNCLAFSMYCNYDCTPNDGYGIWCDGTYNPCPAGNYC